MPNTFLSERLKPLKPSLLGVTVQARNQGPSPASGVQITDKLPDGLEVVRFSTTAGTYTSADGIWDIGSIALGATPTFTIVAKPNRSGIFTTTATKTAHSQTDKESSNNSDSNQIMVGASADVSATFSVSPGPYYNGVTLATFTGTITNNGPDEATGIVYYDNCPSGIKFLLVRSPPARVHMIVLPAIGM